MKKVQLQVALPGGVTLSLRVDRDISLSTIRQYIYEHTGLAPNEQALYHGDIALAGNRPLEDYAFAQDDDEPIEVRVERGLLGGAWCCICFVPCPPPCCKKKDDSDDDDSPKNNYYPSK